MDSGSRSLMANALSSRSLQSKAKLSKRRAADKAKPAVTMLMSSMSRSPNIPKFRKTYATKTMMRYVYKSL